MKHLQQVLAIRCDVVADGVWYLCGLSVCVLNDVAARVLGPM
jgi:hypothetical protein